jgi:prophage regulatory protein
MEGIDRIIRKPELFAIVPLSDPTIWRMEKRGDFPKRIKLGGNSVGWLSSEISAWLSKKATERFFTIQGGDQNACS